MRLVALSYLADWFDGSTGDGGGGFQVVKRGFQYGSEQTQPEAAWDALLTFPSGDFVSGDGGQAGRDTELFGQFGLTPAVGSP
ncbi:hypothetical protein GCM10027280_32950 [Micromonospora polyrhachis]|uniref:Uncharacterized protein n=1 Tax=Micromonospora polyrhachis TaxID=1282883 RepID=A0A7W7WRG1_9ACTN|nr:hypothetical protein [Micromonospora polyrhachis]MBB4960889.1 hypothetical protein [Micromonospora polyrhachis]